jgi:hypothetical protein
MEAGRRRFHAFIEHEDSEGKETAENLGSHYTAEMEVPVSYANIMLFGRVILTTHVLGVYSVDSRYTSS